MAFRAWNRGLALVNSPNSYGVWTYNGTTWVPNSAFPGAGTCSGSEILWAGKLDYWVIGSSGANWPALCRYDAADFVWQTVPIPQSALAAVPTKSDGTLFPGAITSGACFAWNDCWFFGTYGVVVHWDGTSLAGQTNGLGVSPWLETDYQAATATTNSAGQPVALAVGDDTTGDFGGATGGPLAADPDGVAGSTLLQSVGDAFTASPLTPAGTTRVATSFNGAGNGWIAGNSQTPSGPEPLLTAVSASGAAVTCPSAAPGFTADALLWAPGSLAVLPDGDALGGGELETGTNQPVVADVPCSGNPRLTEFVGPDPTAPDPATAPLVPADNGGTVTGVSVSAANDAWASTSAGQVLIPNSPIGQSDPQPPHLYQYTDGQPPAAPAGDDSETRPVIQPVSVQVFSTPPPVIVSKPPPKTVTKTVGKHKIKNVHLPAAVYAFKFSKPLAAKSGRYKLVLTFKVRRPVSLSVEGILRKRVVARSGVRRFQHPTGRVVFLLDPKRWPTGWKVSLAKNKTKAPK
jgi:hypothetical protein